VFFGAPADLASGISKHCVADTVSAIPTRKAIAAEPQPQVIVLPARKGSIESARVIESPSSDGNGGGHSDVIPLEDFWIQESGTFATGFADHVMKAVIGPYFPP